MVARNGQAWRNLMSLFPILSVALWVLLGSAPLNAQTTMLSGPGDFSGQETVVDFEELGLFFGVAVPVVDGVEFVLDNGSPAKFLTAPGEREFGPQGLGSINNFTFYPRPYSDLHVLLPESVGRVGFEMRVNTSDSVIVSLFSEGTLVDELPVPNLGNDKFHFYGFENAAGFDEVLIDVEGAIETVSLDNLSFESVAESAEVLTCDGFASLRGVVARHWRNGDRSELRRWWRAFRQIRRPWRSKLLFAQLRDADDVTLGEADLGSAPRLRVHFDDGTGSEPVDVTDAVLGQASGAFVSTEADWWVAVARRNLRERGTYEITMESGDPSEYVIEPTCSRTVVKVRHPRWRRFRHSWRARHHGDDD